jgi:hypothetical protein
MPTPLPEEVMAVLFWRILVLVIDLYLIAALGPWIALQAIYWLILRGGGFPEQEQQRLERLIAGERQQAPLWPQTPRPGRYAQPDQEGQENLHVLRQAIREAEALWAALGDFALVPMTLPAVLSFGAWRPLLAARRSWRTLRALRHTLVQGEARLDALEMQSGAVADIPERVHALLTETRAELRRLQALYEAEQEAGTIGIGDVERRLRMTETRLEHALGELENADPTRLVQVVQFADAELARVSAAVLEIDRLVSEVAATRQKARNLLERVESSLRLVSQRWEGLKARGATDPSIAAGLLDLRELAQRLMTGGQERTGEAYARVVSETQTYDERYRVLAETLDGLDDVMRQSKEAVAGDVQRLAQAQGACEEMVTQEPLLDPDESVDLIRQAAEAYQEAEEQRALGTIAGYQQALRLSQEAQEMLQQALSSAAPLVERAAEVRELLVSLSAEARASWRVRLEDVRDRLAEYSAHWSSGVASGYAEALAELDAVSAELEHAPYDARFLRVLRQSELVAALQALRRANRCFARVQEIVTGLERERERVIAHHDELHRAIDRLSDELLPSLREQSVQMLPELQARLQGLEVAYAEHVQEFDDPTQVDYDEAVGDWLPSVLREIDEIQSAHQSDVQHYHVALRETQSVIDRQWTRLTRLEPRQAPRPDEDIEKLAHDLDAWREETNREVDNPLGLHDLLGPRAAALQRRIEAAHKQIVEGRRALENLTRQYRRQSRSVQNLRSAVRGLRAGGQWPQLTWDEAEAEDVWEQTVAVQRETEQAALLAEALSAMQDAVNLAQQAEQTYGRLQYQMSTVLARLDEELGVVAGRLEKQQRVADQLRELGRSQELAALDDHNERIEALIDMARSAKGLDDALRHLRDASDALDES